MRVSFGYMSTFEDAKVDIRSQTIESSSQNFECTVALHFVSSFTFIHKLM